MNFLSLAEKEKGKRWIVMGWTRPQSAHVQGNARPRAPALPGLHRRPWPFEKLVKSPAHYFYVSLTFASRPLPFYSFASWGPRPWTTEQWLRRADIGWITQWPALRCGWHLIPPIKTITPQSIAKFQLTISLSTVMARTDDKLRCSRWSNVV